MIILLPTNTPPIKSHLRKRSLTNYIPSHHHHKHHKTSTQLPRTLKLKERFRTRKKRGERGSDSNTTCFFAVAIAERVVPRRDLNSASKLLQWCVIGSIKGLQEPYPLYIIKQLEYIIHHECSYHILPFSWGVHASELRFMPFLLLISPFSTHLSGNAKTKQEHSNRK